MIHVCSLARLHDTVRQTGARHIVTLIKDVSLVHRPATIPAENHLLLDMDDIVDPIEGYVAPAEEHVGELLRFVHKWDRTAPLVVHCYAGISRSTAGAFVIACAGLAICYEAFISAGWNPAAWIRQWLNAMANNAPNGSHLSTASAGHSAPGRCSRSGSRRRGSTARGSPRARRPSGS